ncbi:MAG: transposase [Candidatus Azobacteroides sp.]|nr:transposase [Candidatus Azobacteroides sp.]
MATFKPVTRTKKEYNTVYIRIIHLSGKVDYIKTDMIVHKSGIRKGEITDHTILANCALKIKSYVDKINQTNIENWTVQELKKYLTSESQSISFSDFSRKYIDKMIVSGRKKPAANYTTALNSLEAHYGKKLFFSDITSKEIKKWIESLSETARAKQMYPNAIKTMFEEGCLEYNDYDRNIIKIANRPFIAVKIPRADVPSKRSVDAEIIRKIISSKPRSTREELGKDIAEIIICLAGINSVDLYNLPKDAVKENRIFYNRSKTKDKRSDKAYIEISIPDQIIHLFDKYKGFKYALNFNKRYSNSDNFNKAINIGLKSICERENMKIITTYYLRHTWATIAQNHCDASTELVGFCLNHSSTHRTTEGYITKDFSPIDELNRKVLTYIFG